MPRARTPWEHCIRAVAGIVQEPPWSKAALAVRFFGTQAWANVTGFLEFVIALGIASMAFQLWQDARQIRKQYSALLQAAFVEVRINKEAAGLISAPRG